MAVRIARHFALMPFALVVCLLFHGDWTVRCEIVSGTETSERICAMSQVQTNAQGQRVIAVELALSAEGIGGGIILPFGLAVTQPITLTIDAGVSIETAFSTCVPAGCIVPIAGANETLDAMRVGSTLTIVAQNVNNQPLELPVSLTGFAAATARIETLTQ